MSKTDRLFFDRIAYEIIGFKINCIFCHHWFMEEQESSRWAELPMECIEQIASSCEDPRAIMRLKATCTEWNNDLSDEKFWSKLSRRDYGAVGSSIRDVPYDSCTPYQTGNLCTSEQSSICPEHRIVTQEGH